MTLPKEQIAMRLVCRKKMTNTLVYFLLLLAIVTFFSLISTLRIAAFTSTSLNNGGGQQGVKLSVNYQQRQEFINATVGNAASTFLRHPTSNSNNTKTYSLQENYTEAPLETKYHNKTIVFVFCGRRSRLKIQLLYLRKLVEDGEIDYVDYHLLIAQPEDKAWLESISFPPWFQLRDDCSSGGFNSVFGCYRKPEYQNSTLIKLDDDIVYLPLHGATRQAVHYSQQHPEAAWTSGLVVNHPIIDSYLQRYDHIIPRTKEANFNNIEGRIASIGQKWYRKYPKAWRIVHEQFLLSNGTDFMGLEGTYKITPGIRVSINFMIFPQSKLYQWGDWIDDESIIDELGLMEWTKQYNTSVHVFKGAPAVHFSFQRQWRSEVTDDSLLENYTHLACMQTQGLKKDITSPCY